MYIRYRLHLDLHVTDVCRFGCPWCAYDAGRSRYTAPLETVRRVAEEAVSHGIREVHVYGGEVLHLDRSYVERLLRLLDSMFDHVGLLTKGVPVDRLRHALRYVDSVFISLYPTFPETFRAVRVAAEAGVRVRTSVVVDKVFIERFDAVAYARAAYESGADNIAFMYMSPVSEALDPSTWRRSLRLWPEPSLWVSFLRRLYTVMPDELRWFVRVQPGYARELRGCELHEYVRRVVYYKGRFYPCHMSIVAGLGAGTIDEAVRLAGRHPRGECIGYVAVAERVLGVRRDYRVLVGVPRGLKPECPMRTVRLAHLPTIIPGDTLEHG